MKTKQMNQRIVWKRAALLVSAVLLAAVLAGCQGKEDTKEEETSSLASVTENASVFPDGTTLGGKNIGGKTVEEALDAGKSAMEESMGSLEISVKFKDDTIALQGEDFATQDILELVLPDMLESRRADKFEIPFVADLSEKGKQKLMDAAKSCYVQAKDSSVDHYDGEAGAFVFTDEQAGSRVDISATLKSVKQLLAQKHGGDIQAAFVDTQPKVTKKFLQENFKKLSTYSTVSTNNANGNSNMNLALSCINGTVLKPGDVFSYNETIGDSTNPANGWLPAGGLEGGVSVQTYGGGICQGSTTVYNAAMMAGMELVERDCHSCPSSYCPIGLDATVSYGSIDFRFRNSLEYPVYIASWMDGTTLTVNFWGCFPKEWDNIELGSQQTGSESPNSSVKFVEDQSLAKGQFVRKSSGNSGYYADAWRVFYKDGQQVKTESLPSSYYQATGAVFAVGPGTDTSKIDTSRESGNTEPSPSPSPSASPTPAPTPGPTQAPTPVPPSPPVEEEPTPAPPVEDDPTPAPPVDEDPVDSGAGDEGTGEEE